MADPVERQRTALRAPRVEFDLTALALGAGGWLAYQLSWPALASLLAVPEKSKIPPWLGLRSEFFTHVFGWIGLPYTETLLPILGWPGALPVTEGDKTSRYALDLPAWNYVVVAAWFLVLWTIVGGAIARVYAVRIARDESIGIGDALAFAGSNLVAFLKAPLFVAAAAAFFLGVAALAGAGAAVPVVGPLLELVLHPLALLSGLVVVVFAIGGIFGFPVMQTALAAERNGALDAVSRTFSYVFTRPVAYIVSAGIVAAVAAVVSQFGVAAIAVATRAMQFGAAWSNDAQAAIGVGASFGLRVDGVMGWPQVQHPDGISSSTIFGVYVAWAFTALAWILVNGYVLSYFVGGLADTYFMLRRDVDGIDDSEVYVEGDEASLGEPIPGEPRAPGGTP